MPSSDKDLKTDYNTIYDYSHEGWSSCIDESMIDLDFYHMAQITAKEAKQADIQNRKLYVPDKVARQVDLISGHEIKDRHILKFAPQGALDPAETLACQQHTSLVMHIMQGYRGYANLSQAFKFGNLITANNLLEIWRDRDGNVRFNRLGYNQFLLNPSLRETDLSDCQDIMTGKWITESQAKMLLPQQADKIDDIPPSLTSKRWDRLGHPGPQNRIGLRMYEQWWRREFEFVPTVISRNTGDEIPFKRWVDEQFNGDSQTANRIIKEMRDPRTNQPVFEKFKKSVPKIMLTVFVDNEPVFDGVNPLKIRDHNYIWMHGDWCPEATRNSLKLQSFVRRLRDPQSARNRRFNQIMDIIETQITTLRILRAKYAQNPEAAYQSGQGVVLHTSDEMPDNEPLDSVLRQEPGPGVQSGLFQLIELIDRDSIEATGLNQEIFGTVDKDIPAILSRQRTGAALTGQQGIFEAFREAKSALGLRIMAVVQANYSQSKVEGILNQRIAPNFYDQSLRRDCQPTEGLLTDSQQTMFFQQLVELRQLGDDFAAVITPSVLAKYAPVMFPQELVQAIQQKEQQNAQAAQGQAKSQESINKLIEAQARADVAKSISEMADADQSRSTARLNDAKAQVELQNLETKQITEMVKRSEGLMKVQIAAEKVRIDSTKENANAK